MRTPHPTPLDPKEYTETIKLQKPLKEPGIVVNNLCVCEPASSIDELI